MAEMRRPLSERASAAYSALEISEMLGIQLGKIYREASAGRIPHLRFGKRYVFPKKAIDAWLQTANGQVDAA